MSVDIHNHILKKMVHYYKSKKYTCYTKVPFEGTFLDLVAYYQKKDLITIISVRKKLARDGLYKLKVYDDIADALYISLSSMERCAARIKWADELNIGIYHVYKNKIHLMSEYKDVVKLKVNKKRRSALIDIISEMEPNKIEDLDKKIGIMEPRLDVIAKIKHYLKTVNSKATWEELFLNIPHHYASRVGLQVGTKSLIKIKKEMLNE